MNIIYHKNNIITDVISENNIIGFEYKNSCVIKGIIQLSNQFPNELILWCHEDLKSYLNLEQLETLFHHQKMMVTFDPTDGYFPSMIGYVEESPFININKKGIYPTWQMSSWLGGVHAAVINALAPELTIDKDFTYFLSSLAKRAMPLGLLCYSSPLLLKVKVSVTHKKASISSVYKFVKQHYKFRWLLLLLLNRILYEQKWDLMPFFKALLFQRRLFSTNLLDGIDVNSKRNTLRESSIDVIIPTIGRKTYLYDVLCDLRNQTHLPTTVIIVEQNSLSESVSDLDYLTNEPWPFVIKHTFTHQVGACKARNIALDQVTNEWVFLADDDIRIKNNFFQKVLEGFTKFGVEAVSLSCLQQGEKSTYLNVFQWGSFGSGCSMVLVDSLKHCKFNIGYEFGFGEDNDFGSQLRNHGVDVLFFPEPPILHLKAPIGGFRNNFKFAWKKERIQPKPAPTVMLFKLLHQSKEQILGYKTILFFKYYKKQTIKNPWKYFINYNLQWNQSVKWAKELNEKSIT